jgi:MFS family permease
LVAVVLAAGWIRGATIWPQTVGVDEAPYDDEGVYALSAQLIAEGKQPYRDFFFAHPPLGPVLFAPATEYRFTNWGSPTTFILLRYAALVYSALTAGLAFLIGWRLWGLVGGVVAGALMAIDPQSVAWTGRHVMLESPTIFLMALAVLAYVLARELLAPPPALLILAGFFAAAAGGVKIQGLLVLAAMVIDLLLRRRIVLLLNLLLGAVILWVPLWAYLFWLRDADPLGQFIWMQLLRPGDGLRSVVERARQLLSDAPLLLACGLLGLLALPGLRARRGLPVRRPRRGETSTTLELQRLPTFEDDEEDAPVASSLPPVTHARLAPIGTTSRVEPVTPTAGWTVLLPWLALTLLMLATTRSYYAHYSVELSLPLALMAGAIPLAIGRSLLASWGTRIYGFVLTGALVAFCAFFGPVDWRTNMVHQPDRLYAIVGRYAGDAVGPNGSVFALDAQFPFRAARRPAREEHNRFIVDGYGMLLYHGLRIETLPLGERIGKLFTSQGDDPYAIMWRPAPQEQLRAAMARAELVVIDQKSDGRLTDETRRWLVARGTLVERQDRYVIYRMQP